MLKQTKHPHDNKHAFVESINGNGWFRSHLTNKETSLTQGQDLFPGDSVRATKGTVKLWVYGEAVPLHPASKAYRILPPQRSPAYLFVARPNMRFITEEPSGGRRRGISTLFTFPLSQTVVWPERFCLRWKPIAAGKTVYVRVRAGNDVLWPFEAAKVVLPAGKTTWDIPALRHLLMEKQKERYLEPLLLQWTEEQAFFPSLPPPPPRPGRCEGAITFTLLSQEQERQLRDDLKQVDENFDPLTRIVYRARLFENNGLAAEAIEAYETAARTAPRRTDIKAVAVKVLRDSGMNERADRLERDLSR